MRKETVERIVICMLPARRIAPAQSQSEGRASFEVASIRRAAPPSVIGKKRARGQYVDFKAHQLSGSGWLKSDRYDVVGKSSGPAAGDQMRLMLQGRLADRFKLEIHREPRIWRLPKW